MLFLGPRMRPDERLDAIERSARRHAVSPRVQQIVQLARESALRNGRTDAASYCNALLQLVAAAPWQGDPDLLTDGEGQYVDTNVAWVIGAGGDCVERTHALLALFYGSGLDARPSWVFTTEHLDHMAPVVLCDGSWQWADPMRRPAVLGLAPQGVATLVPREG